MFKFSKPGFAPLISALILLFLAAGIGGAVALTKSGVNFLPRAAEVNKLTLPTVSHPLNLSVTISTPSGDLTNLSASWQPPVSSSLEIKGYYYSLRQLTTSPVPVLPQTIKTDKKCTDAGFEGLSPNPPGTVFKGVARCLAVKSGGETVPVAGGVVTSQNFPNKEIISPTMTTDPHVTIKNLSLTKGTYVFMVRVVAIRKTSVTPQPVSRGRLFEWLYGLGWWHGGPGIPTPEPDPESISDTTDTFVFSFPPGEATSSCRPRPACLDSNPRCLLPEPADGWCPPITCIPRPPCLDTKPVGCKIPEPAGRWWCPAPPAPPAPPIPPTLTSCQVNSDCSLINVNTLTKCNADACTPIDYSQAKWTAANAAWYQKTIEKMNCGPGLSCAPQPVNDQFQAVCQSSVCQKVSTTTCNTDADCNLCRNKECPQGGPRPLSKCISRTCTIISPL